MKKIGLLLFAAALIVGVVASLSFGSRGFGLPHFSIRMDGVKGSGNIIKEKRDVSGFTRVETGGIFQVEITKGSSYSVEVEADDNLLPLIETEVRGDTLAISSNERIKSKSSLIIRITAPDIEAVEATGASRVTMSGIDNARLAVTASGAAQIKAEGKTEELAVDLSGAGRLSAADLAALNANVEASGASNADVKVTGDLRSDLSGASHLTYFGTPASVNTKKSGASSVSSK